MSFNLENIVRESVKSLKPYSSARDDYKSDGSPMTFLDANENPFDNQGLNRYPDPWQRDLKARLSELKNIQPKNMLLGNGSDEVLDLIVRAFCEPGKDEIIINPPTYGMYKVIAGINNGNVKEVTLSQNFQLDIESIGEAVNESSKIIFLCSPNNPTGNLLDSESIERLLSNFKGLVVIDEAYIDFTEQMSWITRLKEYPNLIVTQTLSKAMGMAGIRLGMCFASEAIIEILNKIKPPYNVNGLSQSFALKGLERKDQIDANVDQIIKGRQWLQQELMDIEFIEKVYPSESNFLLIKVDNANKRYKELIAKSIVIRNRSTQPRCEECLRITVGTKEENENLINVLKQLR